MRFVLGSLSKQTVVFLAGIALLAFMSTYSWGISNLAQKAAAERSEARQHLLDLSILISQIRQGEINQRDFLSSANDSDLAKVKETCVAIQHQIALVKANSNSKDLELVNTLSRILSKHYLDFLGSGNASYVELKSQTHHKISKVDQSLYLKTVSDIVNGLQQEEQLRLSRASQAASEKSSTSTSWVFIGDTISVLILIVAMLINQKSLHALRESQTRLQMVMRNSLMSLWSVDQDGHFTHLEGWSATEQGREAAANMIGKSIYATYPNSPAIERNVRRALAGESFGDDIEMGGAHYRTTYAPMYGFGGDVVGAAGLTSDITSQKLADFARDDALQRERLAQQATLMKSAFLANMSHELRTPLNGIIGMTNLVMEGPLSEEQRDYGETAVRSAESLLRLVNDILDLSKAEAGKIELEKISFNLDDLISDIRRTTALLAKEKGLNLTVDVDDSMSKTFSGDPIRIHQVITNLIGNSIKFTSQGEVRLKARMVRGERGASGLHFEVSDTGIGIKAEALDRIFDSFSQEDASTTRRFGGTGLGLCVCKHLVMLMGGEIGVASTEGRGSTFWFTVPMDVATRAVDKLRPPEIFLPAIIELNVLIAEDNEVNQVIAAKMIRKLGHKATVVSNGQLAVAALETSSYDLVFMDCQMPELDGYGATRAIRSSLTLRNPKIPIIALTANAMSGDRDKCLQAGMSDYISKPMKASDIKTAIERAMAS